MSTTRTYKAGCSTPGPWVVQTLPARVGYPNWVPFAVRCKATNVHLATVGNVDRFYEGAEQKANAYLMAAAPRLYSALRAMLYDFDEVGSEIPSLVEARAALADARTPVAKEPAP